jgi:hypothetical protein
MRKGIAKMLANGIARLACTGANLGNACGYAILNVVTL